MLTTSDRIKLIRGIASTLGSEEWPLIDLTLRQFKLPTTDSWSGERLAYVLQMIEDAGENTLLELASHLGIEHSPRASQIDPTFWQVGHFRLFVSHLVKYKAEAAALQENLLAFQVSSFIAHKDIEPTKKWQDEIELALSTADALVALLRPKFRESYWTDQEIGFALGRSLPILTVRLGDDDPYGFLAREQAIQGRNVPPKELARAIFQVFARNKRTRRRVAELLVYRFTSSFSFQNAKENFELLKDASYWDEQLSKSVASAVKQNSQVAGAFGIPEKVKHFLNQRARRP